MTKSWLWLVGILSIKNTSDYRKRERERKKILKERKECKKKNRRKTFLLLCKRQKTGP